MTNEHIQDTSLDFQLVVPWSNQTFFFSFFFFNRLVPFFLPGKCGGSLLELLKDCKEEQHFFLSLCPSLVPTNKTDFFFLMKGYCTLENCISTLQHWTVKTNLLWFIFNSAALTQEIKMNHRQLTKYLWD